MSRPSTSILRPLAVVLSCVLAVAGCGPGPGTKVGGPPVAVTLRLATANGEPGYAPAVDDLGPMMAAASNGNLILEPVFGVGGGRPDAEQAVVRGVADGTYDLGVVGTRVFDTLGVDELRALTAPLLIVSYEHEHAVLASELPVTLLASLDRLHVTGLGLLAGGLQKPAAVERPLRSLGDWRDRTIAVMHSTIAEAAISALDAQPLAVFGQERDAGIEAGRIDGYLTDLVSYRFANAWHRAPYVTANVSLWPNVVAVIANPARLAALTAVQRDRLRQVVGDASRRSTDLVDGDLDLIPGLCQEGARFATADEAEYAALERALSPVLAELEADPALAPTLESIRRLSPATARAVISIPDGCDDPAPSPPPSSSPQGSMTTETTLLDGTWEVTFTAEDLRAARDVDPSELAPGSAGTFRMTFDHGRLIGPAPLGNEPAGDLTYAVGEGNVLTIYAPDASMGGQVPPPGPAIWQYSWSVYQDTLTLKKLGGQEPDCSLTVSKGLCEPSVFIVKPWHRLR